jgi:hypothetical protein
MMDTRKKTVTTTLEEDFKEIGVVLDPTEQAGLSGILTEDGDEPNPTAPLEYVETPEEISAGTSVEENENDPIDGPIVTRELLERVSKLPFENFEESDFDELLDELKTKALPDGDDELREMAETVVKKILDEKVGTRMRRAKSHSMGRKVSFQCGIGFRTDPNDPTGKRCVRAAVAAGGKGKLTKEARKKRLWGRGGKGMHSKKVSARWRARRESVDGLISPFAAELASLTEASAQEQESVRDEIMGRIARIFHMLHEEFLDPAVTEVYENVYEELDESWEAGRLDEEVMESEDFIAEVKPALNLIIKSLDRLDRIDKGELSGN